MVCKKGILISLLLFFLCINIYAQSPSWAKTMGSNLPDEGSDITTDAAGNVYSCGRFSGTVDFDYGPGIFNLTSNGSTDIYLTKYSNSGQFIWARAMGGTGLDGAYAVEINNTNEVILTGYIRNTVDMDPGPGIYNLNGVSNQGIDPGFGGDLFLAKYTPTGGFVWAFSVENDYWQNSGRGIAIDDADNIYLGGHNNPTSGTPSDFDPGPGVAVLSGGTNGHAFLAKYTTNGNYIWGFTLGEYGQNSSIVGVEIVPGDTTLIITGHIKGSNFDVDPNAGVTILNAQQEDIFAGRYSFNMAYLWAFNCSSPGIDVSRFNAIDSSGNFYTTGVFSNTIDFDPGPGVANFTSAGNFDAFISKYDISGNYKWTRTFGSTGVDHPWDIGYKNGQVISVGYFNGTVDFDPGAANFNLTSAGGDDAYITQFDTAGNFICAARFGGAQSEQLWGMKFTHSDTILINGFYSSNNIDVDPTAGTMIRTNAGTSDIIFGKYYYQNTPIAVSATVTNDSVCPGENPAITMDFTPNLAGTYSATISDGINTYTVNNISDNIPFSFNATPAVNTNYTVTVSGTINSNCNFSTFTVSLPFVVYLNPLPLISCTANPPAICSGSSTVLTGSGGGTYTWSGGIIDGNPFSPGATATYTVTGTDANGCSNTSTTVVTVNPLPNITANANPPSVCPGNPTILTGSGGASYIWSGGIIDGVSFIPLANTTYTVTGTDVNGCTNTSAVTVTLNPPVPVIISLTEPIICIGDSVQLTASGALNYVWENTPGLDTYTGSAVWASPVVNTTYTVTGTDANGCTGTSAVTINISMGIDIQVTKNRDAECEINIVQLEASGAQNYSWTPAALVTNPSSAITNATVTQNTTFYVTGNTGSCTDMDSITVYYYNNDETGIIIPNAFSPNGDGINDCLRVLHNANFTKYYFAIYNRWGQNVFETDDPDACWNGMINGKDADISTFYYYLKAETICGKIFKKGDITLVR